MSYEVKGLHGISYGQTLQAMLKAYDEYLAMAKVKENIGPYLVLASPFAKLPKFIHTSGKVEELKKVCQEGKSPHLSCLGTYQYEDCRFAGRLYRGFPVKTGIE